MTLTDRRIRVAERASQRTRRRATLLLAMTEAGADPMPSDVARLDRLIGQADELWMRLALIPEAEESLGRAEVALRRAWRVGS